VENLDHLIGKEYETVKLGYPARIVAIAKGATHPVVALVTHYDGSEEVMELTEDLRWDTSCEPYIQEKAVVLNEIIFINVYEHGCYTAYKSKDEAYRSAVETRIACVPTVINYKKGDGL